MKNWITLSRGICDHWIYTNPDHFKRWVTILLKVNFKAAKFPLGNEIYICEAGQSYRSLEQWGILFGCSKKTVLSFFRLLEKDEMVTRKILGKGNQKRHLLTVVNWDKYQKQGTEDSTIKEPKKAPQSAPYKEEETLKNIENNEYFFLKQKLNNHWDVWKTYLKEQHRIQLGITAENQQLKLLQSLSQANIETAGRIIDQAMNTLNKSFIQLKTTNNGRNTGIKGKTPTATEHSGDRI